MEIDALKLENQLCFPLYACSKEVVRKYRPFLEKLGLTYTQYIVMLVLWEEKRMNVKSMGQRLYLDSGTLTPLLKKLENDGLISKVRDQQDERNVVIKLTSKGESLKEQAKDIPEQVGGCISLSSKEAMTLYQLLYKVLNTLE